jgi:diaminohydroxyphosphoribosylaminopyrimidine deaminase/5-amino-6-(5-phosphoribosylamino)uracil reductase
LKSVPASEAIDLFWMRRALAEAERGRGAVEPNPMVGAVVVRDGQAVGVGHHARFGGPHAEIVALQAAAEAARTATLYVTLEPCCHQGKTPPCTEAILRAGIRRVVASHRDPFPRVAGGGFEQLVREGIEVACGVAEQEARLLNGPYLKRVMTGRPFVTAKWAMTLDGKMACASGESRWISGSRSRAMVQELRGRMDAIIVGIGTALADDPALTARPPGRRIPQRVVLDGSARLPLTSQLVRTAQDIPVLVAVTDRAPPARRAALEAAGCEIVGFSTSHTVPIDLLLELLGQRQATNLLVEGGGRVLGAFWDADQIDAVEVYIAPILEGGPPRHIPIQGRGVAHMAEALRLRDLDIQVIDGDVRLRGLVPRFWQVPESA